MSYTVTKYPPDTFSWTDVSSTDFEATKKFITSLWDGLTYTIFNLDGKTVAGRSQMPPFMKGMPSF